MNESMFVADLLSIHFNEDITYLRGYLLRKSCTLA